MLYQPHEVEISQSYLQTAISRLKEPICILGGWAICLTVREGFIHEHGRDYLGSRDIDLGFHIDRNWGKGELEGSVFAHTIKTLEEMGFEFLGFRLAKYFNIETRQELSEGDARRNPSYLTFDLYVDPVVDSIHPLTHKIFGFVPIDEPLLEHVFIGHRYRIIELFGRHVLLPLPEVLLATKLKSVGQRNKEHKRVKDIADIYALSWYSNIKFPELRKGLEDMISPEETKGIVEHITREDIDAVSNALGIEASQVKRVLIELS